uniref:SGTA homodimerisation domain-containing protein n=2 Tax=Timema genevievae TaxID=629358 RepID=A0A7R9JTD5_TIMGE|nr:unnamed protein product [Timema genevievae]
MSDTQQIICSIIHFLKNQLSDGSLSQDGCESLEVAIQCLESAYELSEKDLSDIKVSLPEILKTHTTAPLDIAESQEATPEQKTEAEKFKSDGNNYMKTGKYLEALDCYTKAIKLDGKNAVYYCNRAASFSKLNNHQAAIEDCKNALKIDSTYSKAYGRLGLAYTSLKDHIKAKESYIKALELEPDNESYKNNLLLTEEMLTNTSNASPNFDIGTLLANPALMTMATQMLSDPGMQNMMSTIMSGNVNPGSQGMDALLQARFGDCCWLEHLPCSVLPECQKRLGGREENRLVEEYLVRSEIDRGQHLAQHIQSVNPELVDQLRRQLNNSDGSEVPNPEQEPRNEEL